MRRPVYDGVPLGIPFPDALDRLARDPVTWLPPPVRHDQAGLVVTMHATGLLAAAGVAATVEVGELEIDPPGLAVRPIAWRAQRTDRVFPRLVADLELSATSPTTSRLTLVGGYQPPISVIGDAGDRLVGRHLADAVIRTFLERVAATMEETAELGASSL